MTLIFIRIFFIIISMVIGYQIGNINDMTFLGIVIGLIASLIIIFLESGMRRVSVRGLSSVVFGLILGIIMAKLISDIFAILPLGVIVTSLLRVILTLVFSYLGAVMAIRGKDEFNIIIPYIRFRRQDIKEEMIILDTSAIIDGRIVDIYKTKFFEARLLVPRFVLGELQHIADSSDPIKRQRGRRGLEMLQAMQKDTAIDIRIHEEDVSTTEDVDAQLVRLAKVLEAKIFTTDFNLNRIAALQGVKVLNINELANALKPVVFPGEVMEVRLLKEGKEFNQAVAYLDDGTMVVVEDARKLIGQLAKVNVTSVLQTQAGRMIFAKLENK
ncbi:MAG: TRAM domain-containing protein [Candidatus Omnitrophota bacterium]|nr:TRAM domain-containing protein [Candidatus Omnitrophota bacterium]